MNKMGFFKLIALVPAFLLISLTATAEMALLPEVTFEMTNPAYWVGKADTPDSILSDASTIEALNSAFLSEEACRMKNLLQSYAPYDGTAYRGERVQQAMSTLSRYMSGSYFRADGMPVRFSDVKAVLESIDEGGFRSRTGALRHLRGSRERSRGAHRASHHRRCRRL